MNNHYLNTWLLNFPDLQILLSENDKAILDTIDPVEYIYHNLTRNEEVIRIINDHKPQAWKWERLYPNLKNLSPEDHEILDHIPPTEFDGEVTEEDIYRIIEFRKDQAHKKEEEIRAEEARKYYKVHEAEILRERRDRNRITKFHRWADLFGIGFITAGIVMKSVVHIVIGSIVLAIAWGFVLWALKRLNTNSVTPRSPHKVDDKLDFGSVAFAIVYYIGYIGVGIIIGSLLIWSRIDWVAAQNTLYTGLAVSVSSVLLFFITLLVTSSSE